MLPIQSFCQKQLLFANEKYYFYYVHMQLQSYKDTDNKNTLIPYEE